MKSRPNSTTDSSNAEKSKPLVDAKLVEVKVDLKGLADAAPHAERAYKNTLKAIVRGVGTAYGPLGRVFDAWADRKAANMRASTAIDLTLKQIEYERLQRELSAQSTAVEPPLEQRAFARLAHEVVRNQENREKLIEEFVSEVRSSMPKEDASQEIDDDWLTQFWNLAETVQNSEVRKFYSRLLTREVTIPGTISPVTLRILTTLTPDVAKKFQHFCCLSIDDGTKVFVMHPNVFPFQNIGPMDDYGISYNDLFDFETYGLIRSAETIMLNYAKDDTIQPNKVHYAGQDALLNFSGLQLHELRFTRAGKDICRTLPLTPVAAYTTMLENKLQAAFKLGLSD